MLYNMFLIRNIKEKHQKSIDFQCFYKSVGVTRFELATTRPPEEKFIFSDKSN